MNRVKNPEHFTTTIKMKKEVYKKFRAMCICHDTTVSEQLEEIMYKFVEANAEMTEILKFSKKKVII